MDKYSPVKEDSKDLARELLIAISESVPEKANLNSTLVHENSYRPNGTLLTRESSADRLRADLISISYTPSPDKIALPASCPQKD